jgi:hypothetical protein
MVPALRAKGLTDEQIAQIVIQGFSQNSNLKVSEAGKPSDPKAIKDLQALVKSLK